MDSAIRSYDSDSDVNDTNGLPDIFVRDLFSGTITTASVQNDGTFATNQIVLEPVISANGRYVIYRGLDAFPKIRLVDLQSTEPPRTNAGRVKTEGEGDGGMEGRRDGGPSVCLSVSPSLRPAVLSAGGAATRFNCASSGEMARN